MLYIALLMCASIVWPYYAWSYTVAIVPGPIHSFAVLYTEKLATIIDISCFSAIFLFSVRSSSQQVEKLHTKIKEFLYE